MNDVTRNELVQAITIGGELAEELADAGRPIAAAVVRLLVEHANAPAPMRAFVSDDDQRAHEAAQRASSSSTLETKGVPAPAGHRHKWQFDAGLGYQICMADPDCKAKPRKSKGAAEGGAL